MRVLLVEDHLRLGQSLHDAMSREAYSPDWVVSLADARAALACADYSLVLLDLGLPDGSGLELLKSLRASGNHMPVLVMTARGGLNDRIDGLDRGADDYLVKPFAIAELLSRCRALLRRPASLDAAEEAFGNIELFMAKGEVRIQGHPIMIARRELQLLHSLLKRRQRLCSRAFLENELYNFNTAAGPNALEASVSRLRAILKSGGATATVRTVRGVGYILELGDVS
ncbi:response regulator transcription factor [Hyphomonas sp.]|jgi:DNA-binding response OmpR family regulator|uniref:response regulator n=1 Tax=Hyphomonas sp. TaxID=87 RepID=UPI0025BEE78F|nr:response regulator transcription factor [Hyphomonas sp.]